MNRRTIVALTAFAALTLQAQAIITTLWGCADSGAYLYNSVGGVLDPTDLRIEMVVDLGAETLFSEFEAGAIGLTGDGTGWDVAASAVTDTVVTFDKWLLNGTDLGYFLEIGTPVLPDTLAGETFYFRWFNSATVGGASEAGVIYGSTAWTLGDPDPSPTKPAIFLDYTYGEASGSDLTSGGANGAGWATVAAVPEPGSMGLLALGLVTLVARKRKRA